MILGRTGSRSAFRIWAVLILALSLSVLSSLSWGACVERQCSYSNRYYCNTYYSVGIATNGQICIMTSETRGCNYSCVGGNYFAGQTGCTEPNVYHYITCDTQAETDSVYCVQNPTAEGCVKEDVPASCEGQYSQCMSLGGVWTKVASTSTQCASECNLCSSSAQTITMNAVNRACCAQNKAPPDSATMCSPPVAGSGWGMSGSIFQNADGEISCGELTTSSGEVIAENAALYKRFCIDNDEYEERADSNEYSSSSGGSSSSEESSSSWQNEMDGLAGLYGVLDTIRDTLTKRLTPATEQILTCLQNAGLCPGLGAGKGDTTIVNVYGDSSALKVDTTLRTQIKPLMQDGLKNDTLTRSAVLGVGEKVDSLIDSSRKYLKRVADSVGAVNKSVENLPGGIAGSLDSAIMEGYNGVDTNGVSYGWLEAGDSLADSILGGSGYAGLNFAADSSMRDSLEALGYVCTDSNCCVGSECIEFDSQQSIEDSLNRMVSRMGDTIRQKNQDFYNDSVTLMFQEVKDSLYAFNPLGIFDSTIMSTLGASIPNSNVCPDHCSTFQVSIPFLFGMQNVTIDWGLCMGRAVFANGNVLSFLRFIIRIIVAVTCITAVMWNATRIRR